MQFDISNLSTLEVLVFLLVAIAVSILAIGVSGWMFNVSFHLGKVSAQVGGVSEKLDDQKEWNVSFKSDQNKLDQRVSSLEIEVRK